MYVYSHKYFTIVIFCIEILRPDPVTPSIVNGGVMLLTGPCFSMEIEKIKCAFTDQEGDVTSVTDLRGRTTKRDINGITVNGQAVCPLPFFRRLGNHNVTITLKNGTKYTGNFFVGMLANCHSMHVCMCLSIIIRNSHSTQCLVHLVTHNKIHGGHLPYFM